MRLPTVLLLLVATVTWSADESSRRVLALYDSIESGRNSEQTMVHALLAMPLNHLGFTVDFCDVSKRPLPDATTYRALVSWFGDDRLNDAAGFCRWLTAALNGGTRVVMFKGCGCACETNGEEVEPQLLTDLYAAFGLTRADDDADDGTPAVLVDSAEARFGFEAKVRPRRGWRLPPLTVQNGVTAWRTAQRGGRDRVVVAVGPRGGWIENDAVVVRNPDEQAEKAQWDLDPFAFLNAALRPDAIPAFDVATVNGRRAAFAQIDGDGFANRTAERPGRPMAAAVIRDEIIRRYPVPITVGFIAGDLHPAALGNDERLALARSLAAEPTVQLGCHGYAHPLIWARGIVALKIPGYRYTPQSEIGDAIQMLDELLKSSNKRVELFQWTGDCLPDEATLALAAATGLPAMNGGDTRSEDLAPGIAAVAALVRVCGAQRQVYAAAANENIFTRGWSGDFGAYRQVIDTLVRTGTPRRLKPVDLYYHFFSGERSAGVRALTAVYDWALTQPLCWITAAEYVRAVEGFHRARLGRLAPRDGWWAADYGACGTLRFDGESRQIDAAASRGVVGWIHNGGDLYVSLDAAHAELGADPAQIVFTAASPSQPMLAASTSVLKDRVTSATSWQAAVRLYAPGGLVLDGCAPGRALTVTVADKSSAITPGADGRVTVPLPSGRGEWVTVHCAW